VGRTSVGETRIGKPGGKRLFGRSRHSWQDIRMDIKEIGWKCLDWIHLAQGRDHWQALVNMVINLRVSQKVGEFLDK
jgi:hypothetical protein